MSENKFDLQDPVIFNLSEGRELLGQIARLPEVTHPYWYIKLQGTSLLACIPEKSILFITRLDERLMQVAEQAMTELHNQSIDKLRKE